MSHPANKTITIEGSELIPLIKQTLCSGSTFKLVVTGGSMRPFLRHRKDSVLLSSPRNHPPKRGDIILIERKYEQKYVLHRICKLLDDGCYLMNGDAQTWTEIVTPEQIIGVVETIYRKDKMISCEDPAYRFLSSAWAYTRPVRRIIFRPIGYLKRKFLKPEQYW